MDKGTKIAVGFIGIGFLYYGFVKKNVSIDAETSTDNLLNEIDSNLLFSEKQIQVVIKDLSEVNNDPIKLNYLVTWRGLIQVDLESQLAENNLLTFAKMQTIQIELTGIFRQIVKTGNRLLSAYCKRNNYTVSDRIYTLETNLVNISKKL
jgi:hypothetical protein